MIKDFFYLQILYIILVDLFTPDILLSSIQLRAESIQQWLIWITTPANAYAYYADLSNARETPYFKLLWPYPPSSRFSPPQFTYAYWGFIFRQQSPLFAFRRCNVDSAIQNVTISFHFTSMSHVFSLSIYADLWRLTLSIPCHQYLVKFVVN